MYAGGKNYYRITPDITGGQKKEDYKVADAADPTFTAKGQTITFPGGKIIEDAVIPEVKSCGYWIETAKDVFPVVTYSENRYEQYPAFLENYESFKADSAFDFNAATPSGCYEVKKSKDGTAKIVAVDGNNVIISTKGGGGEGPGGSCDCPEIVEGDGIDVVETPYGQKIVSLEKGAITDDYINSISVSKLVQSEDEILILNGGKANGYN
jgi:hypothetical protein